jgi:hypothetical protein
VRLSIGGQPWPELELHGPAMGSSHERGGEGGEGGRCWEAPWGAARALGAGCGPAPACVRALCCSWTMLIVRREEEEGERRGKRKGRKRKRKKRKKSGKFSKLKNFRKIKDNL